MVSPNENALFKVGKLAMEIPNSFLNQKKIVIPLIINQVLTVKCYLCNSENVKYVFTVVDSPNKQKLKWKSYKIFIVPKGQETS